MLDANYIEHCKVLGKICRLWDDGGLSLDDLKLLACRLWDQIATGESPSYDACLALNPFTAELNGAMQIGQTDVQRTAKRLAEAYLTDSVFYGDLTTTPGDPTSARSVLEALQTEMGAGEDDKTFTTKAATGLVYFFDTNWAPTGAWNTEADETADYKDSVYVVTTIVA